MIRLLTMLSLLFCMVFILLMLVARTWGQAHPSALLAYAAYSERANEIRILDLQTSVHFTLDHAAFGSPTWSSDGRLAFPSYRNGDVEVYIWDGEGFTNISQNPANDYIPMWSSDGRLAFVSDRDGN